MKRVGLWASLGTVCIYTCALAIVFGSAGAFQLAGQTQQPFLFAGASANGQSSVVTFVRNDATGVLTLATGTSSAFQNPCTPTAIDPKARFLFGPCGNGVSMYTLNTTTGAVAEVPNSPFAVTTSNTPTVIAAEATGQFVYVVKTNSGGGSGGSLDAFQIDSVNGALVPVTSYDIPIAIAGAVADPQHRAMYVYCSEPAGSSTPFPTGSFAIPVLYTYVFDPVSGQISNLATAALEVVGNNPISGLASDAKGRFLAYNHGLTQPATTIAEINAFDGSTSGGSGATSIFFGTSGIPTTLFFDPSGQVLYVRELSAGVQTWRAFDTQTLLELPSSPLASTETAFLSGIADPAGPFMFAGAAGGGISAYQVDPTTGLPSQTLAISSPFYPQLSVTPQLLTLPLGGQPSSGPNLQLSTTSINFGQISIGQTSAPQIITITSNGNQAVSLTSIVVSGPGAADFLESDTCMTAPVLSPGSSCTVAVRYAPTALGTSQAALVITDNAPGSPQQVALGGLGVEPAGPAPAVTFTPSGTLNFAGTTVEGSASAPQTVTLTNSGNATLQFSNVSLSGLNVADFAISSNHCTGSLTAGGSCTIAMVFSPLATGARSTTLVVADNAANSPQSLTIRGTGGAAVVLGAAPGGSTSATISAGQSAQYSLQATPAAGFSGTLTFNCTGAPFVATCNVPSSVSVGSGIPTTFTVSVSTTSGAQVLPNVRGPVRIAPRLIRTLSTPVLTLLAAVFAMLLRHQWRRVRAASPRPASFQAAAVVFAGLISLLMGLIAIGGGCGGGGSTVSPSQQLSPPSGQTPTLAVTATPVIQPGSGVLSSGYPGVTITDPTAGATIYYTTDGSTPSGSSQVYASSFQVTSATTVQAIASAKGYANSAMTSATYRFQTPSGTSTVTLSATAIPSGSTKQVQLTPVALTLIVK